MKAIQFNFTELSSPGAFENIANVLKTEIVNNTIVVPASLGTGMIQWVQLAEGLQVTQWETCLHSSLEIFKAKTVAGEDKFLTLTYSFTAGSFFLKSDTIQTELELQGAINLLFDSGNQDLHYTIAPGETATCLVISMGAEWLKNEFNHSSDEFKRCLHNIITSDKPALFYEAVPQTDQKILVELNKHFTHSVNEPFFIKGNTMLLLSYFFNVLFGKVAGEVEENNILHHEKITAAEKILIRYVSKNLPSVHHIAREVALSESTLKRYFRVIYGTSIYEYYLKKKMEYARLQLMEKKLPVKEVAYMLGYEKSSSFIRIFKKFYTLPPGHIQKENRKALAKK